MAVNWTVSAIYNAIKIFVKVVQIQNVLLILLATLSWTSVTGCAITNITHLSEETNSISLHWDLSLDCPDNPGPFQVLVKHQKYLACNDRTEGPETRLIANQTDTVISNLMAYSLYEIKIWGFLNTGKVEKSITAITKAGLPNVRPIKAEMSTNPFVQSITFYWSSPNQGDCRLRNGKPNGYRIEVWGVDPWVNQGKPLKVQDSIFATQYYAQHLVPYTRYKLKVFAVNGESVYNPALPLEIVERTLATIPAPPEYVKVTLKEARKVHLNWRPKYPANGLIRQYVIRVGVVTENAETKAPLIIWRRRIEVLPHENYCKHANSGGTGNGPQFCFVIDNLEPRTNYNFQVQVFNENVTQPSEFSEGALAKTDASKNGDADEGKDESVTQSSVVGGEVDTRPSSGLSSTAKILVIVLTLGVIVILVIACTALYYKIKMNKLELLYEQSRKKYSGPADSLTVYPQIVSFSRGSGGVGAGHVILPRNGMTTANYVQSVANQIEEIQSRRLPEPPPLHRSSKRHSGDDDDDNSSEAYVKIENDSGNSSLVSHFHRNQPPDLLESLQSNRLSIEDTDGYLKPTFHRFSTDSNVVFESDSSPASIEPIPIESYVTRSDLLQKGASHGCVDSASERTDCSMTRHKNDLVSQSSTTSESRPLISITEIQL